jgi:hypothetical protein
MHKIRIAYAVISIIGVVVAYRYAGFVTETASYMNYVSYYGTVATVVGLLIAISEVLHSVSVTKSVRDEARSIFDRIRRIESASSLSDCLAAIDDVSNSVSKEDYQSALKSF